MRLMTCTIALALLVTSAVIGTAVAAGAPLPSSSKASSTGLDALARTRLVGEHRLTLQWIGFDDLSQAGSVMIRPDGSSLTVDGEHVGRGEYGGDYLRISGRIVSADQEGFVFTGDILTRVSHVAEGRECKRSGTFHFLTKGVRKYWRLQEMDNPCSDVTDYVDIYFPGV